MRSSSTLFSLFVSASLARALSLLGTGNSVADPASGSSSGIPNIVSNLLGGAHPQLRRTSPLNTHGHGHRHRHPHNGKPKPHVQDLNATTPAAPAVPAIKHVSKPHVDPSPLAQLLSDQPPNEKRVVHGFGLAMGMMKKKRGLGLGGINSLGGVGGLDTVIAHLTIYRDDISGNRDALQGFASQSREASFVPTHLFQTGVAGRLTDFQTSIGLFSTTLHSLGDAKGLLNYDRSVELETLLKDVVNMSKDALDSVSSLVFQVPVLGGILGPIVYSLKCVLDDVLNATENMLDGVMNMAGIRSVNSLLNPLIATTMDTVCGLIALNGLCVL